jgi:1-acyl-sn-glycerol-3-phosphate acyltransferase
MNRFPSQPLESVLMPERAATSVEIPVLPLMARLACALAALQVSGPSAVAERAARLKRLCSDVCLLHGIDVELRGTLPERAGIIVANHLGYIDPIVLCSLFACSPIAKHEIASWALIGEPLKRLNVTFVRRGDAHSGARVLRRCLRLLEAGLSILNFPEGTTTRGELRPFHLGAFWLARQSGLPLIPIGMEFEEPDLCWVDDDAFLPHYTSKLWPRARRSIRVSIGAPLDPGGFQSEIDLAFAARAAIMRLREPFAARAAVSR